MIGSAFLASLALSAQEVTSFEQRFVDFLLAEVADEKAADIRDLLAGATACKQILSAQNKNIAPAGWSLLIEDDGFILKRGGVVLIHIEEDEDVDEGCFTLSRPSASFDYIVDAIVRQYKAVPLDTSDENEAGFATYNFDDDRFGYQLINLDFENDSNSTLRPAMAFGVSHKDDNQ